MASYTISTAVTVAGNAQPINTGDTVTVTSSGSLTGTGAAGVGIYSSNTGGLSGGFDTLSISGTVRGSEYGFEDTGSSGHDSVTVNTGGGVFGGYNAGFGAAIYVEGGANTISNDGHITNNLGGYGIELSAGGNTIDNTGTISTTGDSAVYVTGGFNNITNSGTIASGDDYAVDVAGSGGDSGHNVVSNSGTVTGAYGFLIEEGSNTVTNTGTISTSYTGIEVTGTGNTVTNSGTVSMLKDDSAVDLDGNQNTLTNSGTISGGTDIGVAFYGTNDVIHNTAAGTILGGVYGIYTDSGASAVIVNAGVVQGGDEGMYLEDATGAHVKVTRTGSVLSTSSTGIYAYGSSGATGSNIHITVKGMVQGDTYGIGMYYDNNVVKVGAHGSVIGVGDSGIYDESGANTHIFNAGTIKGEYGIDLYNEGAGHIHNTGTIIGNSDSAIYISDGSDHVTNQGTISGEYCALYVVSGTSNVVTNQAGGIMKAYVTGGTSNDATLYFSNGVNTVTNSGKMSFALHGATGDAVIYSGGGSNVITNNAGGVLTDFHGGVTTAYAIELKGGSNSVTNDGKIVGTVQIGASGTNTYDGSGGHLKGTVMGGTGVDTIVLGAGHSSAEGNGGADSITVGTGADNLVYTTAADSFTDSGGSVSYDTVDGFVAGTDTFTFNLGTHPLSGLDSVTVNSLAAANTGDINTAIAGHLDPYGAVALSVTSGLYAGDVFLIVDADNNATFSSSDYLVVLTHLSGTLTASDIITT